MARSLLPAATAGLSALVLITGCGSGTPPDEWTSKICGALTPWRTQISDLNNAYAHARDDLAALPTQDAAVFYDGVTAAMNRLNREYAMSAVDPSRLDSPELRRAFDGAEQCR
jgi:hypothetical protein